MILNCYIIDFFFFTTLSYRTNVLLRVLHFIGRVLLVVFGSVAAVASCRIAYKYLKRRRRRAQEDSIKKQLALGRRERRAHAREKNLTEVQLCVVCTENPKEVHLRRSYLLNDSCSKSQLVVPRRLSLWPIFIRHTTHTNYQY